MPHSSNTCARLFCVGLVVFCVHGSCAMDVPEYFPEIQGDLTKVSWAHAVNSKTLLQEALEGDVMMLEADVVMGMIQGEGGTQAIRPVMAHPPKNTSDLSLDEFVRGVVTNHDQKKRKGIKLDFKSTDALMPSLEILQNYSNNLNFPVWLNADILRGPVNSTGTPVDASTFLSACAETFPESQLSVGWKTTWGPDYTEGSYTEKHVQEMIQYVLNAGRRARKYGSKIREVATYVLRKNNVTQTVTFPVRGGIAAHSLGNLQNLVLAVPNSTLTVWSSEDDAVDAALLRRTILAVGKEKVYVDVPEQLKDELNLSDF